MREHRLGLTMRPAVVALLVLPDERRPRMKVAFVVALAAAAGLGGCASAPDELRLPNGIAVLGDSISRATNALGTSFGEHPAHSWATGADANDSVRSHVERLRALDPALDIVAFNDARGGARIADLPQQAEEAVRQGAEYVVVLIGANDVCSATPTQVLTFHSHFVAAAEKLAASGATVFVASVPDVPDLIDVYGDNATARAAWDAFGVCPGVLGKGIDIEEARARVRAYNDVLRGQAAARGWAWDGGAVSDAAYASGDVSTLDFFHPSLEGQARLAEVTWNASPFARWAASTT